VAQAPLGPVEVRTYQAKNQQKASELYAADAAALGQQGLFPSQQVWSAPRYWRLVLTPIILVAVGILIFGVYGMAVGALIGVIYVIAVRPKGTMTVTYARQQPAYQLPPQ